MKEKLANTSRPSTGRRGFLAICLLIVLIVLFPAACTSTSRSGSQASRQNANSESAGSSIEVSPAEDDSATDGPCSRMFSNFFLDMDSVSYDGYEVVRGHGEVFDKVSKAKVPVSYASLMSQGTEVMRFEGLPFGAGNATRFGFASLLGGEAKQLIISQTAPRGGRHWVVDLGSVATVLFDSHDWELGREDVCVHDFDGDGIAELILLNGRFCDLGSMSMSECPLVDVVFKYDPGARKYLPDRDAFARGLEGISEDAADVDENEQVQDAMAGPYLAARLDIFLRYAYGGREQEAWEFFEKSYKLADKQTIEQKIRAALEQDPTYRFVRRTT